MLIRAYRAGPQRQILATNDRIDLPGPTGSLALIDDVDDPMSGFAESTSGVPSGSGVPLGESVFPGLTHFPVSDQRFLGTWIERYSPNSRGADVENTRDLADGQSCRRSWSRVVRAEACAANRIVFETARGYPDGRGEGHSGDVRSFRRSRTGRTANEGRRTRHDSRATHRR